MAVHVFESPNQGKIWVGPWRSVDNAGRVQVLMRYFTPGLDAFSEVSVGQEKTRLKTLLRAGHKIDLVGVADSMHGLVTVGALHTRHTRKRLGRDVLAIEEYGVAKGGDVSQGYSPYRRALGALVYGAVQGTDPGTRVEEVPRLERAGVLGDLGISQATTIKELQEALTDEFGWLRDGRVLAGTEELINPQSLPEEYRG